MIYHKFKPNDRQTVINELYDDEFVTYCTDCSKEITLDIEEIKQALNEGGSFDSTYYKCVKCSDAS